LIERVESDRAKQKNNSSNGKSQMGKNKGKKERKHIPPAASRNSKNFVYNGFSQTLRWDISKLFYP